MSSPLPQLDLATCRSRQRRLLDAVSAHQLDLIVVTQIEHVQWLAGPRFLWYFQPSAALTPDGRLQLVAPRKWQGDAAADDVARYDAQWHSTLRNDQRAASLAVLRESLAALPMPRRVGVEYSSFGCHGNWPDGIEWVDIEPDLYRLRRRKDPDELACLRRAVAATGAMYRRAREIIRPGVSELEVFNALQTAAVLELGELLTGTGNDYQCGARGGPLAQGGPPASTAWTATGFRVRQLAPTWCSCSAKCCARHWPANGARAPRSERRSPSGPRPCFPSLFYSF